MRLRISSHRLCLCSADTYYAYVYTNACSARVNNDALSMRVCAQAVEAAQLKIAAERLDEERRLRKIYGNGWQKCVLFLVVVVVAVAFVVAVIHFRVLVC